MTIADQLVLLDNTKSSIAAAIEAKGVPVGGIPFSQYPDKILSIETVAQPVEGWKRPDDWLMLPEFDATDNRFIGLFAVFDADNNAVSLLAAGNYTVDWGDGSVENFSANAVATHVFSYSSLPAETTTSAGYRQAIITVTPQVGQSLTTLNLQKRPAVFGSVTRNVNWLDIVVGSPALTTLMVGTTGPGTTNKVVALDSVQRVRIVTAAISSAEGVFRGMNGLRTFVGSLPSATSFLNMFASCAALLDATITNSIVATNLSRMFDGCTSLVSASLPDTGGATNMSYMFNACYALAHFFMYSHGAAANLYGMFNSCFSILYVSMPNSSIADISIAFANCTSLAVVVIPNASYVAYSNSAFINCNSLRRILVAGMKITHSVASCNLSAAALNELFENLGVVASATITINGNPGAATCNTSIATSKGWTVTA